MTNHPKFTESHDSAARSVGYEGAREIRLLRIVAMPVTLLVNVVKGLWFLLCALADLLWDDAFGERDKRPAYPGSLWLCYHALKHVEWAENGLCNYCFRYRHEGHLKDCMVGNSLQWVSEFPTGRGAEEVKRGVE